MRIVAKTDQGLVRKNNQDSYAAGELPGSVAWAVVCDGMGGTSGGEIASKQAVKVISDRIASTYRNEMSSNSIKNLMMSAITAGNVSVYDIASSNESLSGMGTTVVAAIVKDGTAHIAHAGDSRAYKVNQEDIVQLTKDHSMVQEMLDGGQLTKDEMEHDPRKHIITRALGVEKTIKIDYWEEDMDESDTVLLCTDGLTNYVQDEKILSVLQEHGFYALPDHLVSLANKHGGGDNITVVAIAK